jgi:hypothetical protein
MQAPAGFREGSLAGMEDGKPQVFPFHAGTILREEQMNEFDRRCVFKATTPRAAHFELRR